MVVGGKSKSLCIGAPEQGLDLEKASSSWIDPQHPLSIPPLSWEQFPGGSCGFGWDQDVGISLGQCHPPSRAASSASRDTGADGRFTPRLTHCCAWLYVSGAKTTLSAGGGDGRYRDGFGRGEAAHRHGYQHLRKVLRIHLVSFSSPGGNIPRCFWLQRPRQTGRWVRGGAWDARQTNVESNPFTSHPSTSHPARLDWDLLADGIRVLFAQSETQQGLPRPGPQAWEHPSEGILAPGAASCPCSVIWACPQGWRCWRAAPWPEPLDLPAELPPARAFQQINVGNEQDGLIELILRS